MITEIIPERACRAALLFTKKEELVSSAKRFERAAARQTHGPFRPAVVLLDIRLPKIDGLEVLRRIRADERTRELPVVMLASSDEDSDMVRSYDLGANGYVRKPVEIGASTEAAMIFCTSPVFGTISSRVRM